MNMHGDHTATCYCCRNLFMMEGSPGYSEWTPAEPAWIQCRAKQFESITDYGTNYEKTIRTIMTKARDCPKFLAREESHG